MLTSSESRFAQFFRAHYLPAVGLTQWRAPGSDAEAIVAEAFLVAWQRALAGEELSVPWFYRTLRNKIGDHYRSHQRRELPVDDLQPLGVDLAGDTYEEIVVNRILIYDILNDIPLKHAEPLALVYGCDLSQQDAAKALGISHGALRKRLERARVVFASKVEQIHPELAVEEG